MLQLCFHCASVRHTQVIFTRAEEAFDIGPWRREQRDATRHRFKNPYCRYSTQAVGVLSPRHVQSNQTLAVNFGSRQVRKISAKLNSCGPELFASMVGITNSMDHDLTWTQSACRADQELFQFTSALFVTPITYPDQGRVFLDIDRLKVAGICSFVECPRTGDAEAIGVNSTYGFAEGQNTIHTR